jgi:uncharacterized protein (TIGR03435 family)
LSPPDIAGSSRFTSGESSLQKDRPSTYWLTRIVGSSLLILKEHNDSDPTTLPNGRVLVGSDTIWTSPYQADFISVAMGSLATGLSQRVGRDVIDKTGLTGHYNFTLAYPGHYYDPTAPDADDSHIPEIFDSLAKLGLKLESAKIQSTKIVVDHIDRPTED